jgi:hypothetical protein
MSVNASLAVFLPYDFNGSDATKPTLRSYVCALALALQHVHDRDPSIVPELANLRMNFNLSHQLFGTEGNASIAVNAAMDFLYESRALADGVPRAMLGPAYSELATPMALMAGAEQVPMVSYWAASPKLSPLPYFTRTFPSDSTAGRLLVHLLYNGSVFADWNHVAVVYQDDEWGQGYVAQIELEFKRLGLDALREPPDVQDDVPRYRTLRTFSFATESGSDEADANERDSVKLALDAVKDYGSSVIVIVAFGPSLVNILEAIQTRTCAPPAPVLCSPHSNPLKARLNPWQEANRTGLVTSEHAWLIADGKGLALPEIEALLPKERRARVRAAVLNNTSPS